MGIYINGIGSVTSQRIIPDAGEYHFSEPTSNRMQCQEPDYKDLVPPMQLRRMSKVVRIGAASAKQALKDANIERPDMITLGTAYGCLADTENFLSKLLQQDESMLTPTAFIQSTHNTVSGQIALMTQCVGHNFTYVHRGHSFETSLQEAILWMMEKADHPDFSVMTGGIDELTTHSFEIIERFGTFKKPNEHVDDLTDGCIAGEGANLFVLSPQQQANSYAELINVCLCQDEDIETSLHEFLTLNQLKPSEIDTCLIGLNGDQRYDQHIRSNIASLSNAQLLTWKKWSGEFPTSGAFALTLASMILKHGVIPDELYCDQKPSTLVKPKNVIIYNHYKNRFHSFILLKGI